MELIEGITGLSKTKKAYNNKEEIIIGVSGILVGNYKLDNVFSTNKMAEKAFELSLKGEANDVSNIINDAIAVFSYNWNKKINELIKTKIKVENKGYIFYPLYFKTIEK